MVERRGEIAEGRGQTRIIGTQRPLARGDRPAIGGDRLVGSTESEQDARDLVVGVCNPWMRRTERGLEDGPTTLELREGLIELTQRSEDPSHVDERVGDVRMCLAELLQPQRQRSLVRGESFRQMTF